MTIPSSITDLSETAASNSPSGSESVGPSLDDYLRAIQAIARAESLNKGWERHNHTVTWLSGTTFSISGDKTSLYTAGRRLKFTITGPTTTYGTVSASAYAAGTTTVTVVNDSTALTSPISEVQLGADMLELIAAGKTLATTADITPVIQGLLSISGANVVLTPYRGNKISINGTIYTIPSTGVSLAPPGASASTTFYIYAYDNAGTLTLEYSATAYATDTTTGLAIKSADATRTLVGMARTDSGSAWSLCRSWVNDPGFTAQNAITSDATTSSTTYVEVGSGLRTSFLAWDGEIVNVYAGGRISGAACSLAFDGTTAVDITGGDTGNSGERGSVGMSYATQSLSEGYHYATLLFKDIGSSGCTVYGEAFVGNRATVQVAIGSR